MWSFHALIAYCSPVESAPHDDLGVDVGSRLVPRHSHEPWNSEWSVVYFGPRSVESTPVNDVFSLRRHSLHFAVISRGLG